MTFKVTRDRELARGKLMKMSRSSQAKRMSEQALLQIGLEQRKPN
jgi:hypothetical protein